MPTLDSIDWLGIRLVSLMIYHSYMVCCRSVSMEHTTLCVPTVATPTLILKRLVVSYVDSLDTALVRNN